MVIGTSVQENLQNIIYHNSIMFYVVINNIDNSMEACIPVAQTIVHMKRRRKRKDNYNFKDPFTESLFTWQPNWKNEWMF